MMEFSLRDHPTLALYVAGVCVAAILAYRLAFGPRKTDSSTNGAYLCVAIVILLLAETGEYLSLTVSAKAIYREIQLLAEFAFLCLWYLWTRKYTGIHDLPNKHVTMILAGAGLVVTCVILTNQYHNVVLESLEMPNVEPWGPLEFEYGSGFWPILAGMFLIYVASLVTLTRSSRKNRRLYRAETIVFVLASVLPWTAFLAEEFNWLGLHGSNVGAITIAVASIAGIILFSTVRRSKVLPIAHAAVFESMRDPILVLDLQRRIVDLNKSMRDLLKIEENRVVGKSISSVWNDIPADLRLNGEASTQNFRYSTVGDEDTSLQFEVHVSPICDSHGRETGVTLVLCDVTATKRLERQKREVTQQLAVAQKDRSLNDMAAGIAHQYNNLLTRILGFNRLAMDQFPEDECLLEPLSHVERAAEQAIALTSQMRSYSGNTIQKHNAINICELIFSSRSLLEDTLGTACTLNLDLQSDIATIDGNESQLTQLILNLLENSREAMGQSGGEVTIRSAERVFSADDAVNSNGSSIEIGDPCVCVDVVDTGCGIDPTIESRVFDPFFSTKFVGRGLGLSTALGIVRTHDGAITLNSESGTGTTVCVILPILRSCANPKKLRVLDGAI